MDSAEEKKWFIYVGDHHEGPFSLNDLRGKMAGGIISNASYTWAEGMADWQLMTEVKALAGLFSSGVTPEKANALAMEVPALETNAAIETIAPPVADSLASPMSVSLAESVAEPSSPRSSFTANSDRSGLSGLSGSGLTGSALKQSNVMASVALETNPHIHRDGVDNDPRVATKKKSGRSSRAARKVVAKLKGASTMLVVLAIVGGLGYAYGQGYLDPVMKSPTVKRLTDKTWAVVFPQLLKLTEKAPFLSKWITPIPSLPDVSAEDYEELRQAAIAKPDSQGAHFAVAMSKESPMAPVFYVAANLSDGARLRIVLSGVSDTLVDATFFNQTIPVSITKKFSKTDPFKPADGKLPKGQYLVTLVEAADNPPNFKNEVAQLAPPGRPNEKPGAVRPLAAKSYFLGGARDANYGHQLKVFHEGLIKKAGEELLEAKAYSDLFDKQLTETNQRFEVLHKQKKIAPPKKKMWTDFHAKWLKLWGQVQQGPGKWTADSIKAERFYAGLYLQMSQLAQSIEKVHQFQDSFVSGNGDKKALEIQIGEAQSGAGAGVAALKSRLEAIEKMAVPAGGLPVREDQIQ